MTRKLLFVAVVLVLVLCAANVSLQAQSNPNCTTWLTPAWQQWYSYQGCPPDYLQYQVIGPWLVLCQVQNPNCAPAPESMCPECERLRQQNRQPGASSPISLATGDTYIKQTDVNIPGLGGGLKLVRTWNSIWPSTQSAFQVGMFGPNWRSTYEERVFAGSDGYIKYARSNGNFWSFGYSGGMWAPAAPANATATLAQGSTYWSLTFQDGEQRQYNFNSGSLTAIIDRNGNTTSLSYDATNRLTTVTDAASRTLTFSYGNSSYPNQVTGVSSSVGLSLTYAYDSQGRLSQVTYPDSTTITLNYNSQSLITSVTDQNNKVLESHTYDSNGRGLTGSQANGVNAVTITYH